MIDIHYNKMTTKDKDQDILYYIYMFNHGLSGHSFTVSEDSKYVILTMLSDVRFNFIKEKGDIVKLCLYSIKTNYSQIQTFDYLNQHFNDITPIITFEFPIIEPYHGRIIKDYDGYNVSFSAIKRKEGDYYLSNPIIKLEKK